MPLVRLGRVRVPLPAGRVHGASPSEVRPVVDGLGHNLRVVPERLALPEARRGAKAGMGAGVGVRLRGGARAGWRVKAEVRVDTQEENRTR